MPERQEVMRRLGRLDKEVESLRAAICGDDGDVEGGLRGEIVKMRRQFALFFGLGIGAMAASGLIEEGAKDVVKSLIGLFL